MTKKSFKVPFSWEMYGHVTVKATSKEEAVKLAEDKFYATTRFPKDSIYIQDSCYVDDGFFE